MRSLFKNIFSLSVYDNLQMFIGFIQDVEGSESCLDREDSSSSVDINEKHRFIERINYYSFKSEWEADFSCLIKGRVITEDLIVKLNRNRRKL